MISYTSYYTVIITKQIKTKELSKGNVYFLKKRTCILCYSFLIALRFSFEKLTLLLHLSVAFKERQVIDTFSINCVKALLTSI